MHKTIQARVNTVAIPTTGIYPTLPIPGIASASMGNLPINGNLPIEAIMNSFSL